MHIHAYVYVRGRGRVYMGMYEGWKRRRERRGWGSYINKHRTATEDGRELLIKGWVQWGDILAEGNASAMDPHEGIRPTHVHLSFTSSSCFSVISSPSSQTRAHASVFHVSSCVSPPRSHLRHRQEKHRLSPILGRTMHPVSVTMRWLGHLVASGSRNKVG